MSTYHDLLARSGFPSLQVRRLRVMALECFKILHGLSPSYLDDFIVKRNTRYSFRYINTVNLPRVRTEKFGRRSFRFAAPKLWNDLPIHMRADMKFEVFRAVINRWDGSSCSCSACTV